MESNQGFGWFGAIKVVADTTNSPTDAVENFGIYKFLNWLAYAKHKAEQEKQNIEQWKNSH